MIYDFLMEHAKKNTVSFHMPGHKGSGIYADCGYGDFLSRIVDCDITEITGADNLFQTEGIILETQKRYAALYDVMRSYLLINGTSGGLIAAILATVEPGGKLIMARNCHKSVFNALALGNIQPVYAYPDSVPGYEVAGPVSPQEIQELLRQNPDAQAVILPSPNYYGICSDIKKIAEVVHRAGKVLIVDQAHGAHLHFFHKFGAGVGMPLSAESCGADIVVDSTHKTLASFTQSAVLNLNSDRVDRYALEDKLQAIQSTSPSYLLMASLDINAAILESRGAELIGRWKTNIERFYQEADGIPGLTVMRSDNLDPTKINLDMSALGLTGSQLEEALLKEEIYGELYAGSLLMCMTGIGNTPADFRRLGSALSKISATITREISEKNPSDSNSIANKRLSGTGQPAPRLTVPGQAIFVGVPKDKRFVPLEEAAGAVCAGSVIPYPPGIPLVCPGERFDPETVSYIRELRNRGEKVIGVNDRGDVLVGG